MIINAIPFYQQKKEIYLFKADPNFILNMVDIKRDVKNDHYFQRPYDEKRINEIRNYLLGLDKLYKSGKDVCAIGYIPNAIVINLSKKFKIEKKGKDCKVSFPDNPKSSSYKNSIQILDGQHRLLAFDDQTKIDIGDDNYEMCFVAFQGLSIDEKREIFMVLNERQKSVSKNILLRHKKLLNLLLEEDETRYEILIWLTEEVDSPFYQKIIVSGEKIKYGIKLTEFDKNLTSSKALDDLVKSDGQLRPNGYKVLKNYFSAWKDVYDHVWFKNNTLTKMAGIRFMCHLFPYLYNILKSKGRNFKVEKFKELIIEIKKNYFNDDFNIKVTDYAKNFLERGETIKLARIIGKTLKDKYEMEQEDIIV